MDRLVEEIREKEVHLHQFRDLCGPWGEVHQRHPEGSRGDWLPCYMESQKRLWKDKLKADLHEKVAAPGSDPGLR